MARVPPPILLFGMPRSGTTWIGKIFDSHPDTLYRHEPDSWGTLNAIPLLAEAADAERHRAVLESFLAALPEARKTKVAASLPVFPKAGESHLAWSLRNGGVTAVKALSNLLGELSLPRGLDRRAPGFHPVWKSIESTGRLGLILRVAPGARAIHIIRHPCGFVSSVLRGEAGNKFESGKDSTAFGVFRQLCETPQARRRGLDLDAFKAMSPAERLAMRWLLVNEKAMEECAGAGNYLAVSYDAVCADPAGESRRMFAFAGLTWPAQTETFVAASTAQDKQAYYSVFKNPLAAANKWRTELPARDIERIMALVAGTGPARLFA